MRWAVGAASILLGGCAIVLDFDGYGPDQDPTGVGGDMAVGGGGGAQGGGGPGGGGGGGGECAAGGGAPDDPESCGPCGVNCLGGSCTAGECQPVQLVSVTGPGQFGHLALDDTKIYWVDSGAIFELSKATMIPGTPAAIVPASYEADFIAVDADNVYFTTLAGSVLKREFEGGLITLLSSGESMPVGLALRGTDLYWAEFNQGTIRKQSTSGGSAVDVATGDLLPFYVAVDSQDVYWTFRGDADVGGVKRLGAPSVVASGQFAPSGLTVDDAMAYWINFDGAVRMAPKAGGGAAVEIAPPERQGRIFSGEIAVDATHVYWTGVGVDTCMAPPPCDCVGLCGKVWRARKDGSSDPEVFAEGDWGAVHGLALDAAAVYWTTGTDARLFRKAKGP